MVFDIIAYKNIYNKYEGEGNMEALILVLFLLIMILLGLEAYQVKRDRALLQHVVYVNGIRGKSTVTRMIAAGLKSGGWSVFCKTTGTVPRLIGTATAPPREGKYTGAGPGDAYGGQGARPGPCNRVYGCGSISPGNLTEENRTL